MRILLFILALFWAALLQGQTCGTTGNTAPFSGYTSPEVRTPVILPVVVHIVYASDKENISDAQVLSQIDILNRDFSGNTPGQYRISNTFRDRVAAPGWQFCLAAADPEGNPSNGIVRVNTSEKAIANPATLERGLRKIKHSALGGSDAWDTDRFINIWVGSTGEDVVIGDATFPGTAKDGEDGVMIDYRVFGGLGTSLEFDPFHFGKTLTHELGHYFNLAHLSGNGGCNEDDGVEDTPMQGKEYFECPTGPVSSCGSEDMVQNFLSLASDPCLLFFTKGQVERLEDALYNYRSDLLDQGTFCYTPGLPDTGLDDQISIISSPSTRQVIIQLKGYTDEPVNIKLYDLSGKLVLDNSYSGFLYYPISTFDYPNGIYLLEVRIGNEKKAVKVVI